MFRLKSCCAKESKAKSSRPANKTLSVYGFVFLFMCVISYGSKKEGGIRGGSVTGRSLKVTKCWLSLSITKQ